MTLLLWEHTALVGGFNGLLEKCFINYPWRASPSLQCIEAVLMYHLVPLGLWLFKAAFVTISTYAGAAW